MDLMSLLAKLTLDKTEYDKGLEDAEDAARGLNIATPKLPKVDNTDFKAGLDEAEENGNIFQQVMTGVWQGLKDSLISIGVVGIVSGLVSSLREGITLATKNGDAISKGAKNLQISTKAYQEYEYALGKSNLKITDLQSAMSKFDMIRGGKITEQQAQYFEELGINAEKASSGVMSAEQMLTSVMDSLADYTGADKGAIIDAFFGKSDKWTGYFDQTSKEIQGLKEEANDLGLIMSEESIQNAAEFQDKTEKIASRLESIKRSFGESILPGLKDAANTILTIIDFFAGSKEKSLSEKFGDTDKKLAGDLLTIEETSVAANSLADKLIAMGDTSKMTADQYAIWKGTAEELISLVPSLGDVIDIETGKIDGNTQSIKDNIKEWEKLARQKALAQAKEEKYSEIVTKNKDLINKQIEVNKKLSEIDAKRSTAMKLMNEYLSDEKNGAGRRRSTGLNEVTAENWGKASDIFSGYMYQSTEVGKATKAALDSESGLAELEKKAAELAKELEKGQQEFEEWSTAADQLFGAVSGDAGTATTAVHTLSDELNGLPDEKHIRISIDTIKAYPKAKGDWSVPYDNYPALLHRGETVLTASQARRYRDGESGGTDSALIVELIGEVRELRRRNIYMDGDKVADLTTERTKNNMNAQNRSRTRALGGA